MQITLVRPGVWAMAPAPLPPHAPLVLVDGWEPDVPAHVLSDDGQWCDLCDWWVLPFCDACETLATPSCHACHPDWILDPAPCS
jgi:hypothetical protein